MSDEDKYETMQALREIWEYLRNVSPAQSGLDGWHLDQLLWAINEIRPS